MHRVWLRQRGAAEFSRTFQFPSENHPNRLTNQGESPVQYLRVKTQLLAIFPPSKQWRQGWTSPLCLGTPILRPFIGTGSAVADYGSGSTITLEIPRFSGCCIRSQNTAQRYFFVLFPWQGSTNSRPTHPHPFPSWQDLFKTLFCEQLRLSYFPFSLALVWVIVNLTALVTPHILVLRKQMQENIVTLLGIFKCSIVTVLTVTCWRITELWKISFPVGFPRNRLCSWNSPPCPLSLWTLGRSDWRGSLSDSLRAVELRDCLALSSQLWWIGCVLVTLV